MNERNIYRETDRETHRLIEKKRGRERNKGTYNRQMNRKKIYSCGRILILPRGSVYCLLSSPIRSAEGL